MAQEVPAFLVDPDHPVEAGICKSAGGDFVMKRQPPHGEIRNLIRQYETIRKLIRGEDLGLRELGRIRAVVFERPGPEVADRILPLPEKGLIAVSTLYIVNMLPGVDVIEIPGSVVSFPEIAPGGIKFAEPPGDESALGIHEQFAVAGHLEE